MGNSYMGPPDAWDRLFKQHQKSNNMSFGDMQRQIKEELKAEREKQLQEQAERLAKITEELRKDSEDFEIGGAL